MKNWMFLTIAIFGEVVATTALKSTNGFTKLGPSLVVLVGYGIAFYFLSVCGLGRFGNRFGDFDCMGCLWAEVGRLGLCWYRVYCERCGNS